LSVDLDTAVSNPAPSPQISHRMSVAAINAPLPAVTKAGIRNLVNPLDELCSSKNNVFGNGCSTVVPSAGFVPSFELFVAPAVTGKHPKVRTPASRNDNTFFLFFIFSSFLYFLDPLQVTNVPAHHIPYFLQAFRKPHGNL